MRRAAEVIHEGFVNYNNNFRRITQRARTRLEGRERQGARKDLSERIWLYEKPVSRTLGALRRLLNTHIDDPEIRRFYWSRVEDIPDGEFSKTFFNSVYRDVLRSSDIDPTQASDTAGVVSTESPMRDPAHQHNYINWSGLDVVVERLL